MSEVINQNVFDSSKKFVDFAGLDYFWEKAKGYIDGVDGGLAERIGANETNIADIQAELNSLSGGESSISAQIENAIAKLDVEDTAVEGQYVSGVSEVDGKITVTRADLPVYETVGSAAAVQGNLDTHIADSVAHITADERTAWNAAKASIDTFLADADMTENAVDTLKELQSYMTSDGAAAAELVNRVAALEGIDHEAYKAADETVLASAKEYADGKDTAMNTRVAALEAIDHDAYKGADETVLASAKEYADGKDTAMNTRVAALEAINHDAYKDADTALETSLKAYADQAETDAVTAAVSQANAATTETLKSYNTKTEVGELLAANSEADQLYAKNYTDELYNSIQFAQNSDIDTLFA